MNKFKQWWIKLIYSKLFPVVTNVNFKTPDDMCHVTCGAIGNSIYFQFLKKPIKLEKKGQKPEIENLEKRQVHLNFFSVESVDRLIADLEKVKTNIEVMEIGEALKNGGELVWHPKGDEEKIFDGKATVQHYKVEIKFPSTSPTK